MWGAGNLVAQLVTEDSSPSELLERTKVDKDQRLRALWMQAIQGMLDLDDYGFAYEADQLASEPQRARMLRAMKQFNVSTDGGLKNGILLHRAGASSFVRHGRRFLQDSAGQGYAPTTHATFVQGQGRC